MEKYPLGVIHINSDVILMFPILKKLLEFDNYDVIVQCKETKEIWDGGGFI